MRGEARQFTNDARELRGMLGDLEIDPRDLDEIIAALRRLEDDRIYQDVAELARLQTLVAERLKRFEFELSRQLDPGASELVLSGSGEVPEEFRSAVEQYYRSLGRSTR